MKIPGRPALKGEALRQWLPEHLKRNPDLTLRGALRGLRGGDGRGGLRGDDEPLHRSPSGRVAAQKKSKLVASERDEGARALWRWLSSRFDVRRLMFVDECGTHISMERLRGPGSQGERASGTVPRNRGKNMTLIASMSLSGMGASMAVEGSTKVMFSRPT